MGWAPGHASAGPAVTERVAGHDRSPRWLRCEAGRARTEVRAQRASKGQASKPGDVRLEPTTSLTCRGQSQPRVTRLRVSSLALLAPQPALRRSDEVDRHRRALGELGAGAGVHREHVAQAEVAGGLLDVDDESGGL